MMRRALLLAGLAVPVQAQAAEAQAAEAQAAEALGAEAGAAENRAAQNGAAEPGVAPPPGAALPLGLVLRDEMGRTLTLGEALGGLPVIFAFADYDCAALCGTALGLAAAALPRTGLRAGEAYRLVVLGLDPGDGPAKALAMRRAWLGEGTPLAESARFLQGDAAALAQAQAALGYRAVRRGDTWLHPLVLFALGADGRLVATLPALGATPEALRAALHGEPGLFTRVVQFCEGIGAGRGGVATALPLAGAATLALLGGGLLALRRRERRREQQA